MRVQAGARGRAAALAAAGRGGNTTLDAARAVEIFLAKRRHKKRYGVQQLQQLKKNTQCSCQCCRRTRRAGALVLTRGVPPLCRDTLSSVLAEKHGITSKAVRDVWKLRTWSWVTKSYWTPEDLSFFLRKHLCASCRDQGVKSWQVLPLPLPGACGARALHASARTAT